MENSLFLIEISSFNKVLKSDFITQGKEIENFEKNYQNILVLNILQQPLVEQQLTPRWKNIKIRSV